MHVSEGSSSLSGFASVPVREKFSWNGSVKFSSWTTVWVWILVGGLQAIAFGSIWWYVPSVRPHVAALLRLPHAVNVSFVVDVFSRTA